MKNLKLLHNPQSYNPDNDFVVHLSDINNETELFEQFNKKLFFPDYFGFNWNALFDMLCDFNWIKQQRIVLVHDNMPILDEKELNIYLEILLDAVKLWEDWKEGEEHCLEVVFPEKARCLIQLNIPQPSSP